MQTYIVLLRGINVGGNKRIKMADLRHLLTKSGFTRVTTYIQSGNIVLSSKSDADDIEALVKKKIADAYGFSVQVMVRTANQWEQAINSNPFQPEKLDPKKHHLTFLSAVPASEKVMELNQFQSGAKEFRVIGQVIYLYYPEGAGRSKLPNNFFEKKLGVRGTSRNWNTVSKLAEMIQELS